MLKVNSRVIITSGLLLLISYISLPNVKNFYYWKDDWIFMWANKLNPAAVYREIGGTPDGWQVKTGLFMLPYTRLYDKISFEQFQSTGIYLKFLNSAAVLLLVYTFTKNKTSSILSSLLYAGYSGGVEVYTWHRITGLAVFFSLLAFAFHNLFLKTKRPLYFLGICISAIMSLFSYFGRVIGIFPLLAISTFFHFYLRPSKFLAKYFGFLVLVIVILIIIIRDPAVNTSGFSYSHVLSESYSHLDILFSNIGNLLRIPIFPLAEEGGLVGRISFLSLLIGKVFFITTVVVTIVFLVTRSKFWQSTATIFLWMAFMFIPNWMYASGGPSTMVGSSHRYMAGIGIGVLLMIGLLLSKLSKLKQILVFVPLLIMFLKYSTYVLSIESSLRNANLVKPIYQKIVNDTTVDSLPRALVIHTSRSNLVSGWFPYAYAYFKGLRDSAMFPTVFSNWDAAAEWICAPNNKREEITFKYAAPDNQKGKPILKTNIYAWSVDFNGTISNETMAFREKVSKCLEQI